MPSGLLTVHPGLSAGSRVPLSRAGRATALEWLALAALGVAAGLAVTYLRLRLGVPGHAILRAVLPLALGLALVPRRLAGTAMSAAGVLTALALESAGGRPVGVHAMTGLLVTGPLLDLAAAGARPGWLLYARLALAGLAANLVALAGEPAFLALVTPPAGWPDELAGPRVASYAACGLAAGLVSAACWFRLRGRAGEGA